MKNLLTCSLLCVVVAGSMALAAPTAGATIPIAQGHYQGVDVHPMIWGPFDVYDTHENCENAGRELERVGFARGHYCDYDKDNPRYPWKLYVDYI